MEGSSGPTPSTLPPACCISAAWILGLDVWLASFWSEWRAFMFPHILQIRLLVREMQRMRIGMTPMNQPFLVVPLRIFFGSFPHSLLSTGKLHEVLARAQFGPRDETTDAQQPLFRPCPKFPGVAPPKQLLFCPESPLPLTVQTAVVGGRAGECGWCLFWRVPQFGGRV